MHYILTPQQLQVRQQAYLKATATQAKIAREIAMSTWTPHPRISSQQAFVKNDC